jgi:hypothetical protein
VKRRRRGPRGHAKCHDGRRDNEAQEQLHTGNLSGGDLAQATQPVTRKAQRLNAVWRLQVGEPYKGFEVIDVSFRKSERPSAAAERFNENLGVRRINTRFALREIDPASVRPRNA